MAETGPTQLEMIAAIQEVAAHNVAISQQILQLALQVNVLRDRIAALEQRGAPGG